METMYLVTVELSEHHDPKQVPRQDFGCLDGGPFLFTLTPTSSTRTITETHKHTFLQHTVMVILILMGTLFSTGQKHLIIKFFFLNACPQMWVKKVGQSE